MTIVVGQNTIANQERTAIQTAASIAKQHARRIKICASAILAADTANPVEDDLSRYTRYRTALNDAEIGNGFRTALLGAFTSETLLVVSMATAAASVPSATRASFNHFYRAYFNTWGFLLEIGD